MGYEHKPGNLVACICEGNAEIEIMRLLMGRDRLCFPEEDLLDGKFFTGSMRSAKNLETRYLTQSFGPNQQVEVIRIIDSRTERYEIRGAYKTKIVNEITNCYTRPEIEMLVILNEGQYESFKRSGVSKPSDYCIHNLAMGKGIKRKGFIAAYFSRVEDLENVLKMYHQIRPDKQEETIYSLLINR